MLIDILRYQWIIFFNNELFKLIVMHIGFGLLDIHFQACKSSYLNELYSSHSEMEGIHPLTTP